MRYDEICDIFSQVYYTKSVLGKLNRNGPAQVDTSPNVLALLNHIRGCKVFFRSVLRADTSISKYTTFARLNLIMRTSGVILTAENRQFIIESYAVSERERIMILPQLKFVEEELVKGLDFLWDPPHREPGGHGVGHLAAPANGSTEE